MNQRRLAILLCLCLILLSTLPTTALTTDLQAAIEESTPSAEQNISPANPTQEQNPMENKESASPSEPSSEEMTVGLEDMRRTQHSGNALNDFNIAFSNNSEVPTPNVDYKIENDQLVIIGNEEYTIRMKVAQANHEIRVESVNGTTLTLQSLDIDGNKAAIEIAGTAGDVTIKLSGDTKLYSRSGKAGLQKESSAKLIIKSASGDGTSTSDALHTRGGANVAGINGKNITIEGGSIFATGGTNAAGIEVGDQSQITISGGNVTAKGGSGGAGIGSGNGKDASDITISGGNVTAIGGDNAAGIGGGNGGNGSSITITGGKVTATGGKNGAGIGGGNNGNGENIEINDGTINATGKDGGAGIGGGANKNAINITINGGTITAKNIENANWSAAGIGGGYKGYADKIEINGGTINATAGSHGAGIGGGQNGEGKNITINGGNVVAIGHQFGSGIGGGENKSSSNIRINGGEVKATGGKNATGIGGGTNGNGSDITISGGEVTAIGRGNNGIAIGGGTSEVTVSPSANHKIEIKAGENENNASTIEGSPFITQNNISGKVNTAKYFNSTTSAYNPPPTPPAPPAVRRYRIELAAEPAEGGMVSGEGRYKRNTEVTVNAAPNSGYRFVHWTENGEIMSTEANYTFSAKKNRMLVAVFAKDIVPTLEKETDDPSHSWTVSFNKELDPADVTSENFYIQDANGKLLQGIRPVLLENSRQVRMENTTRFEENKDYFLVIRKGVRSAKERALAKDVIMKFQYKVK